MKRTQTNKPGPAKGGPKSAKGKPKNRKPKDGYKRPLVPRPELSGLAQTRGFMNQAPQTQYRSNGDIVVRHREYIADVVSTGTAFNVLAYSINPGLPSVFPWLSTIARSFETYMFESLKFYYETQVATTSPGTVVLSIDYDAADSAPINKTQALAYESAVRSAIWSDSEHQSLKKNLSKQRSYFVRGGALASNLDVKLYDVGNLYVCNQGSSAASIGELYVEYIVKLSTPQIGAIGVGESIYGFFSGSSNAAPFATVTGNLPATVVSTGTTTSTSTWTFTQPWEGYATVIIQGTGITSIAPSGTGTELEIDDVYDATAIEGWSLNQLVEDNQQTFILTILNTTITSAKVYFAQADV